MLALLAGGWQGFAILWHFASFRDRSARKRSLRGQYQGPYSNSSGAHGPGCGCRNTRFSRPPGRFERASEWHSGGRRFDPVQLHQLDKIIRQRARTEGKSMNEVAVEALADGLGLGQERIVVRDLSDIVGTWKREAAVETALTAQDAVDEALWK
jgi:hypothetical protein